MDWPGGDTVDGEFSINELCDSCVRLKQVSAGRRSCSYPARMSYCNVTTEIVFKDVIVHLCLKW